MNHLNRPLNDYTIKEIYDNWEELKKEFSSIIDNDNYKEVLGGELNSQKNFNAKLKFVKAVEQYKKVLPNIPVVTNSWSHDEIQEVINKIVNSVENIEVIDDEAINQFEYDIEFKNITFNAEIVDEECVIDELMTIFMEISLTDKLSNIVKDKEGNKVECSSFKRGYMDYMGRKAIATRWFIRDNPKYEGVINKNKITELYSRTYDGRVFNELVNIFGEEKMLKLNYEELSEDFKKFNVDIFEFSKALEFLEEDLIEGNRDRIRKKYNVNKEEEFEKLIGERLKNEPNELNIVSDSLKNMIIQKSKEEDEKIPKKSYSKIQSFLKEIEYNRNAENIENKTTQDFRDTIKVDNNKINNYNKNEDEQYQSRIGLKSNLTREEER